MNTLITIPYCSHIFYISQIVKWVEKFVTKRLCSWIIDSSDCWLAPPRATCCWLRWSTITLFLSQCGLQETTIMTDDLVKSQSLDERHRYVGIDRCMPEKKIVDVKQYKLLFIFTFIFNSYNSLLCDCKYTISSNVDFENYFCTLENFLLWNSKICIL